MKLSVWCLALFFLLGSKSASAEVILGKSDGGWELFTSGRVGGFVEYLRGDGYPQGSISEAGFNLRGEREPILDPATGEQIGTTQGTVEGSRIRSGFVPNVFGIGVRRQLTPWTKLTAYMAIYHSIETEARRKYREQFPDVREGFLRLDGHWGSLLLGRALTLFSRGATLINFHYGHGYAVGNPAGYDNHGPSAGHVGFGVLGSGFASGLVYATPLVAGLQLSLGYYDPVTADGVFFERTKWGRPEAELTYEAKLGSLGRIILFGNGTWQRVYELNGIRTADVHGAGYGGRFEVGPVRLGLAGHYGKGLGLDYALQFSNTAVDVSHDEHEFRRFDGYYAQGQIVLGKVDLNAGWGITRVYQLSIDTVEPVALSVAKHQMGASAVVVYHVTDSFHLAADYFYADTQWWLGEKQVVHSANVGTTVTW